MKFIELFKAKKKKKKAETEAEAASRDLVFNNGLSGFQSEGTIEPPATRYTDEYQAFLAEQEAQNENPLADNSLRGDEQ